MYTFPTNSPVCRTGTVTMHVHCFEHMSLWQETAATGLISKSLCRLRIECFGLCTEEITSNLCPLTQWPGTGVTHIITINGDALLNLLQRPLAYVCACASLEPVSCGRTEYAVAIQTHLFPNVQKGAHLDLPRSRLMHQIFMVSTIVRVVKEPW